MKPPSIIAQIGALHIRIRKEGGKLFHQQDFPLEIDQIPVLMLLYYREALTQQEICSNLERDKASVNRTIAFLTQRDIVNVRPDDADKRKTRVALTPAGKKLGKRAAGILDAFENQLAGAFTAAEKKEFDRLTAVLLARMPAIALI